MEVITVHVGLGLHCTFTCAIDINECINTYGSYECIYNKGYSRNATNGLCEGI